MKPGIKGRSMKAENLFFFSYWDDNAFQSQCKLHWNLFIIFKLSIHFSFRNRLKLAVLHYKPSISKERAIPESTIREIFIQPARHIQRTVKRQALEFLGQHLKGRRETRNAHVCVCLRDRRNREAAAGGPLALCDFEIAVAPDFEIRVVIVAEMPR